MIIALRSLVSLRSLHRFTAEIEEFNFVGAEAADFGFSFGTETFELGDSLKVLISSTLNIIPTVYLFYVTIIKQSGLFNASSMKAYFSLQWQGY